MKLVGVHDVALVVLQESVADPSYNTEAEEPAVVLLTEVPAFTLKSRVGN